jgi:hypothetical protein
MPVMRNLAQFAVVAVTVVTLTLVAAVGVSAGSGKLGSPHATTVSILTGHSELGFLNSAARFITQNGLDKETGQCHPPKKVHKHGTPGHKNHPCGDNDDDTD